MYCIKKNLYLNERIIGRFSFSWKITRLGLWRRKKRTFIKNAELFICIFLGLFSDIDINPSIVSISGSL